MIPMRFIICGPAACGKTVLARRLTEGAPGVRFVDPCRPGRLREDTGGGPHWVAMPQAQGDLTPAEWASADVVFMHDPSSGTHSFQARVQLHAAPRGAEEGAAAAAPRRRAATPPPFRRVQRPLDSMALDTKMEPAAI